ncbi:MAG: hypothetical protein H7A37_05720 [Chlamydiales bacterium]|nr:hypothetical protein [Chlamydiales bacterium]
MIDLSLKDNYIDLSRCEEPIADGYGEYLIYSQEEPELNKEIFKKAWAICNFTAHHPRKNAENPSVSIRHEIKKIRDDLEVVFVPRTLYELGYVIAAVKEEREGYCRGEDVDLPPREETRLEQLKDWIEWGFEKVGLKKPYDYPSLRKDLRSKVDTCWHLIISTDQRPVSDDDPVTQHLAYRLNQCLVEDIAPQGSFLSGRKIVVLTDRYIQFLREHRMTFSARIFQGAFSYIFAPSPFCIQDEKNAQVLRNAIALECHQVAINALILYRAGNLTRVSCYNETEIDLIGNTSLSYGTSLLAGCVRDPTATVLYYTTAEKRDTFAVLIPWKDYPDSPYVVPTTSALVQLLSRGERFHARSKCSSQVEDEHVSGVWLSQDDHKEYCSSLKCDKSLQELSSALSQYHQRAYRLT